MPIPLPVPVKPVKKKASVSLSDDPFALEGEQLSPLTDGGREKGSDYPNLLEDKDMDTGPGDGFVAVASASGADVEHEYVPDGEPFEEGKERGAGRRDRKKSRDKYEADPRFPDPTEFLKKKIDRRDSDKRDVDKRPNPYLKY